MTFASFLAVITGVFKFFDEVKWLVQLLQKTPAEKHDQLIAQMQKEAASWAAGDRPVWDK